LSEDIHVEPVRLESLNANPLLQTGFWGYHKNRFGWQAHGFACGGPRFSLLVLCREILPGFGLAYVPHGPAIAEPPLPAHFLARLGKDLAQLLPPSTMLIRYDLPWTRSGDAPRQKQEFPGLKKGPDVQPASTVVIDLAGDEQKLLAAMKAKTRYNIRLSDKKGVRVSEGGEEDLAAWYDLYRETARRDRISVHSFDYYRTLFQAASGSWAAGGGAGRDAPGDGAGPRLKLLLARAGDELLAGIIVAFHRATATYLYGASSNRGRNLMPNYALQWRALQLAREAGCLSYDLFGIPPRPDPGHPMHGLYRFKTGFGGRIVHRYGCYDLPLRPLAGGFYRWAESIRNFYYRGLLKRTRS
jgi:lipid II:glycine glycyltransferase (peptidoglycan interpeptide bridge formation enzyme)